MDISAEKVKDYNERRNSMISKLNELEVEYKIASKNISDEFNEISKELGVEVNASNIREIYSELQEKNKEEMKKGLDIMDRIDAEMKKKEEINRL